MAKQTVKVKHLGLVSTGKFFAVFWFIFSLILTVIFGVFFGFFALLSTVLGLGFGGSDAILPTIMMLVMNVGFFLVMAVILLVVYPIMGCIIGFVGAFAFNMVVKLSGGLSFDAEIA
ncbi:MAG: hypothetical protein V1875_07945 [Candidatus Altiarchaeota archaeon]